VEIMLSDTNSKKRTAGMRSSKLVKGVVWQLLRSLEKTW
jgi:hypothetical protein